MTIAFKTHQTIEFIGDSVTDCGCRYPFYKPLGNGYVRYIHHLLQSSYPKMQLKIINKGHSGHRITNLKTRWTQDVVDINPDWLFIFIGINDTYHFILDDLKEDVGVSNFSNIYHQLIDEVLNKTQSHLRLVSPFLAENDLTEPFRKKLFDYQKSIDQLGEKFNIPVIQIQPAFDCAMLSKPFDYWTLDRVHPTEAGHMLIALTILKACGFSL